MLPWPLNSLLLTTSEMPWQQNSHCCQLTQKLVQTITMRQWLRGWKWTLMVAVLGLLGLWVVLREVDTTEVWHTVRQVHWGYVVASVSFVILTTAGKAWRWMWLFQPRSADFTFRLAWRILLVGSFLNILLPIARLGDLGRIYLLQEQHSKGQVLGTIVLEKSIEMIALVLTILVILPFTILPSTLNQSIAFAAVALALLSSLYLMVYHTNKLIQLTSDWTRILPNALRQRVVHLVTSGLSGLGALKQGRATLYVITLSILITISSILSPYLLFRAFGFAWGLVEATLLNAVVLIGSLPSSVPANLGVFDLLVVLTLRQLGMTNEAQMLSYALLYHLVVYLPLIGLGGVALWRVPWRPWRPT